MVIGITFFVLFADMLEYPIGKKLPLWLVGMMY